MSEDHLPECTHTYMNIVGVEDGEAFDEDKSWASLRVLCARCTKYGYILTKLSQNWRSSLIMEVDKEDKPE